MPITTLDPFGSGYIREYNVTVRPNPIESDVRVWVGGSERPVQKKVGFHLTNANPNVNIQIRVNNVVVQHQYGYIGYTDYYYCNVNVGDTVIYNISQEGYTTYTETFSVTRNSFKSITLTPLVVLTINPTPSDATVTFSTGTVSGNTCTVESGTTVSYTVSRIGYQTYTSEPIVITSDQTISVQLVANNYTLTISPTPSDATVILTALGYTQQGNSITVLYNTTVTYSASKEGYHSIPDTNFTVIADYTLPITLTAFRSVLNVEDYNYTTTPADDVTLTEYIGSSIDVIVPTIEEI